MNHEVHDGHEGVEERFSKGWADRFRVVAAKAKADVVSHEVIGAAIEVHKQLGPGLLESVYRICLAHELRSRGISSRTEVPFQMSYNGQQLDSCFRLDLLVENLVIVEVKAVERLEQIHHMQLLTYLRLTERWLGLLINFNVERIQQGLRRKLNG